MTEQSTAYKKNGIASKMLIRASGGRSFFSKLTMVLLGSDVYVKLPASTIIGHPYGIVINSRSCVGQHVYIGHQVTLGEKVPGGAAPKIGDHVYIGAGAKLIGGISIGNGCVIGAGSVVTRSFPANSVIAGNPAKLIRRRGSNV